MTTAIAVIGTPGSGLVERETTASAWIAHQEDEQLLRDALAMLNRYAKHGETASEEAKAAQRLAVKVRIRLGQLPEAAPKPPANQYTSARNDVLQAPPAERMALSRARQLAQAAEHVDVDAVLAQQPTAAAVMRAAQEAIIDHQPDPAKDERQRVHRTIRGPHPDTWPSHFDLDALDEGAWATINESMDSWMRWCEAWSSATEARSQLRRIK